MGIERFVIRKIGRLGVLGWPKHVLQKQAYTNCKTQLPVDVTSGPTNVAQILHAVAQTPPKMLPLMRLIVLILRFRHMVFAVSELRCEPVERGARSLSLALDPVRSDPNGTLCRPWAAGISGTGIAPPTGHEHACAPAAKAGMFAVVEPR